MIKFLKWVAAAYSYQFGGWDYTKHQCGGGHTRKGRVYYRYACQRYKHHPGECRYDINRKVK